MSLINEVLRDLDSRKSESGDVVSLPNEVRPLPPAPRGEARRWMWPTALVILAAIAIWLAGRAIQRDHAAPPRPALMPAPAVMAGPASAMGGASGATLVADAPPAMTTDGEATRGDTAAVIHRADESIESLRLARTLSAIQPAPQGTSETGNAAGQAVSPVDPVAEPTGSAGGTTSAVVSPQGKAPAQIAQVTARKIQSDQAGKRTVAATPTRPAQPSSSSTASEPAARVRAPSDAENDDTRQRAIDDALGAGDSSVAAALLAGGLEHRPARWPWAMQLARLQVAAGRYDEALATLTHSLPYAMEVADYRAFLGTVTQRLGRPGEAAGHFRDALRLKPSEAKWWVGLGIALESQQRGDEARAAYGRARELGGMPPDVARFVAERLR